MKLGICGDRCDVCPRFIATRNNDDDLFGRIKRVYVKVGLRDQDIPPDSLTCRGCSPENTCAYSLVRDCAIERKVGNCGECPDYPCEKINMVFQKTENFIEIFRRVCTGEEFALFEQAFFSKKAYLDRVAKQQKEHGSEN